MPRRRLIPVLLAAAGPLLAACSTDVVDGDGQTLTRQQHLELYCETKPCECVDAEAVLFSLQDPVDPEWRTTGEPYCPAGYKLAPKTE